ncbi:MAG: hypothetical protein MJY72_05325 [Bacteroidales bacterium]|nr:hypothetical protein [Bacteroidales bacterium]
MNSKKIIASVAAVAASCAICAAQTVKTQVIENGGTGPYKSIAVGDETLPTHVIYRPNDLKAAVEKNGGKLPVVVYANGACVNNSLEMSRLLSEVASYGYVLIAIGPYEEYTDEAFYNQWRGVVKGAYPSTKEVLVMGNGERVFAYTDEEKAAQAEARAAERAAREAAMKKASKKKNATPPPMPFRTYPKQMLEALSWITDQAADKNSEYYHMVDLDKVAAMGQSCGGAQTLAVAHDPRIKTCVMLNTGIGENSMQGVDKNCLESLHTPMFYMIGGPVDIAYKNAQGDYDNIKDLPIVMANSLDGHSGTYYEKNGGPYAVAARKWLDWQLKGKVGESAMFLDDEYEAKFYPNWTFVRKNW